MKKPVKRTAKRTAKKEELSAGAIVAGTLIGLGLIAAGTAIGYLVGSENSELERKVRKLDKRTKVLKEMVDEVGHIQIITPPGTFPPFDQDTDLEA